MQTLSSPSQNAASTSSSGNVFALAAQRLAWIDQRQGVLAQNVANLNTPGYVAKDITPFADVLAAQLGAAAGGAKGVGPVRAKVVADTTAAALSIDGNTVSPDQQMEKIAETDTAHQLAMNLYKSYAGLFKTAIGR